MATLISRQRKFIFIHVYKVAGTSISEALEKYEEAYRLKKAARFLWRFTFLRARRLREGLGLKNQYPLLDHALARDIKPLVPDFDTYFKFCFVRNPWDWQVSLYHFTTQRWYTRTHKIAAGMDFQKFIEWRCEGNYKLQRDFIVDYDGTSLVDFIGKLENIEADFATVCDRIGIQNTLPHLNKSDHTDYRSYYNEHTKSLVARTFRDDIEMFGYSF
ncbi:MAG: sulfotransferase family 2 domain-containing protein [Rhodospirillales bacterium]|nr:sulfotransferase family 2 domain-containing protein [Rhodospirillales bacterium]